MLNRKITYGYIVQDGELAVERREAETVKRAFAAYLDGLSYQGIADMLNGDKIPFSTEVPEWNKHKVKRLLEDPRYKGGKGYPAIVNTKTFEQVRQLILSKSSRYTQKVERPAARLVGKLHCEECATKMQRVSGNRQQPGTTYLKCPKCGRLFQISDNELTVEVELQRTAWESGLLEAVEEKGRPAEATRLENEFDRALEKLEEPLAIVGLVQRGISIRSDCCKSWAETKKSVIERIDINMEDKITVHFE